MPLKTYEVLKGRTLKNKIEQGRTLIIKFLFKIRKKQTIE